MKSTINKVPLSSLIFEVLTKDGPFIRSLGVFVTESVNQVILRFLQKDCDSSPPLKTPFLKIFIS